MYALSTDEAEEVSAGLAYQTVALGFAIAAFAVSIAVTGGIAGVGLGIILGAGTAGEIGLAAAALGLAGWGGATIGDGIADGR